MLNLNSAMVGSEKLKELAEFCRKVLGEKPDGEGDLYGFVAGDSYLSIGVHGRAGNPERVMLNLRQGK